MDTSLARPTTAGMNMSIAPATLYRLAGWAGAVGGVLVLVAAARRGGLIPENTLTHAIAPPASALTLFTLTALYLYQRDRAGRLGLVGYVLNMLGLAGLFAIEFATHAIFAYLSEATREELLAGPTRAYFLTVAVLFGVGVITFAIASLRARLLPVPAVVLYLAGFVPASLRGIAPEAVYLGGLTVGGLAVIWLSLSLIRSASADPVRA
jgi:hypothetical protein